MALTSATSVLVRDPDGHPQGESRVRLRQERAGPAVSREGRGGCPGPEPGERHMDTLSSP